MYIQIKTQWQTDFKKSEREQKTTKKHTNSQSVKSIKSGSVNSFR